MEAGYYPPDLVLLQETSITLTELDNMNPERKWLYYYYIVEAKQKEMKEMEARQGKGASSSGSVDLDFPDDFVSILDMRAEKEKLEKLEALERKRRDEPSSK